MTLDWSNTGSVGKFDYVALFQNLPVDPYGYLANQWQWVTAGNSYKTGIPHGPGYWLAYIFWNDATGGYKILAAVPVEASQAAAYEHNRGEAARPSRERH